MPTVIITGGTGLIGKRLTEMLTAKKYDVILFSHQQKQHESNAGVTVKFWDVNKGEIDSESIAKADYVIHLAGANVAEKRWTKKRRQEIIDSRTKSGSLLVRSIQEIPNQIKAVISASAIGWYGEDTNQSKHDGFHESDPPSNDFLGETTRLWEESISRVKTLDKRLVVLRTGIVLSKNGGALREFMNPLKFRVATVLGTGKQVVSWIHIDDICRLYIYAIESNDMEGVYNAAAPMPVSNKELVTSIAKTLYRNSYLKIQVPSFALQLALGAMSVEVLKSATVSAEKVQQTGFDFLYPNLLQALQHLIKR